MYQAQKTKGLYALYMAKHNVHVYNMTIQKTQ